MRYENTSWLKKKESKFGLWGLAESLQQEVISDNIHVSLVYPPDTETPGLEEERKIRPELTDVIIGSAGAVWKAEEVAKKTFDGIQCGRFSIIFNWEGHILAFAIAGLSPQRSFLVAILEVLLASISRLVGLIFVWSWFRSVNKWHANKNKGM